MPRPWATVVFAAVALAWAASRVRFFAVVRVRRPVEVLGALTAVLRLAERVPVERVPVERVPVERLPFERAVERVVVLLRAVDRRAAGLRAVEPVPLVLVVVLVFSVAIRSAPLAWP